MASISHSLEYFAARIGAFIANLLTSSQADAFGAGLGKLTYRLLASRRKIALENLRQAFNGSMSEAERVIIARKVFENMGRTVVELARLGKLKGETAKRIIKSGGAGKALIEVLSHGKGGIVVFGHFGNWELTGAWVAASGFPVDFMVAKQHNKYINSMVNTIRADLGGGIITSNASARQLFKTLKANRLAVIVADQHAPSGGVMVPFFGRMASTAKGPAYFSIRTGAPIIPLMMRREKYDSHILMRGDIIYPGSANNEETEILTITKKFTEFFEQTIRQYPDQWMWTHRRWKVQS